MSADTLERFRSALRDAHYDVGVSEFRGQPVVVGRSSEFKWRWLASRLHTFVIVADLSNDTLSAADYDHYLEVACGYACKRWSNSATPAGRKQQHVVIGSSLPENGA